MLKSFGGLQFGSSSGGFAIVIVEHTSQPLTTLDSSDRFGRCLQRNDQPIAEPLVIALRVIVLNEFTDRFAQRVFTKKDHPFQTAFFDRSDKIVPRTRSNWVIVMAV